MRRLTLEQRVARLENLLKRRKFEWAGGLSKDLMDEVEWWVNDRMDPDLYDDIEDWKDQLQDLVDKVNDNLSDYFIEYDGTETMDQIEDYAASVADDILSKIR